MTSGKPPLLALALFVSLHAAAGGAQEHLLPFQPGEVLRYQVRVSRIGDVGSGRMWIEGPLQERGTTVWVLRFEMEAGKGPIRATDRTASWLDPVRFRIVRFEKSERHVLSRSDEHVRLDLASRRWTDTDGRAGAVAAADPLDELSFIYFLRTLPLDSGSVQSFSRHFDAARNPTMLRVVGRTTLTTPAGIFRTRIVEMRVRDPKRYRGSGVIRIHIDEGNCRLPVRIESRMPVLGETTLSLIGWEHPPGYPASAPCTP